jgi:hypothetical protein
LASTYGFSSTFALLRLSGRLLSGLVAAVSLWSRFHGAWSTIAGDIDFRNSNITVAGVQTSVDAGSIVVGHLQVPGQNNKTASSCPSQLERYPTGRSAGRQHKAELGKAHVGGIKVCNGMKVAIIDKARANEQLSEVIEYRGGRWWARKMGELGAGSGGRRLMKRLQGRLSLEKPQWEWW